MFKNLVSTFGDVYKRRADGSYLGFNEKFEGYLCNLGWLYFICLIYTIVFYGGLKIAEAIQDKKEDEAKAESIDWEEGKVA